MNAGEAKAGGDIVVRIQRSRDSALGEKKAEAGTQGSDTALLLIDFINDLEFPGGDRLLPHALSAAKHTAVLKKRARRAGIRAIYANDNFGQWSSDFKQVVAHCSRDGARGKAVVRAVRPERDDYFVLKPKNSCFFRTPLQVLLDQLRVKKLILTGLTTDICVLFSANDAYLHDYKLFVPADCVAAIEPTDNEYALTYMARVLKADTTASSQLVMARGR